jgi:multiple sugar transport system substrate-binding protein
MCALLKLDRNSSPRTATNRDEFLKEADVRRLIGIAALLLILSMALYGCGGKSGDNATTTATGDAGKDTGSGGGGKLVIAWAQWKPSDYMEALAKDFTKDTGIAVEVKQIPWPQYQGKIQTDVWAGKSPDYDMVVGDSQWLGRGAVEGHYVDLTDWSKANIDWKDYDDNIKTFYCEYNGKIWGIPCEADATGFAYRKDLFEDPKEMADFKAKYKRDLAPPKTWEEFRDVADFFTRPDKKLYGTALFYGGPKTYDGVTMGFMQVLWCEGGELFDPKTKAVQGVINSPAAVKALEFYTQELKKFCPPNSEDYYYDQTLQAYTSGQVATTMDWFTFFPGLVDKDKNPYADKTGFFVSPKGPAGHYVSLGGQGLSISAYSKHVEDAKKFLAWFAKSDTQQKWAKLGGLSCNKQVLASDEFKKATPFNAVFAESVPFLRDFYNNPQYAKLLEITQTQWNAAAARTATPQQAMDTVATQQTQALKEAGVLQ